MNFKPDKTIKIIGVPMDLGASRRGTDMGPSALRIAGLGAAIRAMGYTVEQEEDINVPAMETRALEDSKARYKPQILSWKKAFSPWCWAATTPSRWVRFPVSPPIFASAARTWG